MQERKIFTPEPSHVPKSEFFTKLENRWSHSTFACVGLDPVLSKLPDTLKGRLSLEDAFVRFNLEIIDATADLVCAYKPNLGFYEAEGEPGRRALTTTIRYIKDSYPDIPVILDSKRGDIGNTNVGYIHGDFDEYGADAVTVHPYLGKEALQPYLDRKDKGIIVLVKTSNKGSDEIQNLLVGPEQQPLYQVVAHHIAEYWNQNDNCAVVVGGTYPKELSHVRAIVGDMPILIPGIGTQQANIPSVVRAGVTDSQSGIILSSSQQIIFASQGNDFAEQARIATQNMKNSINTIRLSL